MKNIIAFSLWGDKPLYWVGAKRNIELSKKFYPGWICRFYIDNLCNKDSIDSLIDENVEIVLMDSKESFDGMFWRFLAAVDPEVDIVLSRDTDSRINEREVAAVNEWLKSNKDFHIMRDHPYHGIPILGGLWGCRNGILKKLNLIELINNWNNFSNYGCDQDFLSEIIYPLVKEFALEHCDIQYFNFGGNMKNFPTKRKNYEFVGDVFDENEERHKDYWNVLKDSMINITNWFDNDVNEKKSIDFVIISSDDNPLYKDFYPIVAKRWYELGFKTYFINISDINDVHFNKWGIIRRIKKLDFVSTSFQAQVVRLFAANFIEGNLLISDIDMLPINGSYFTQYLNELNEENVILLSGQPYSDRPYFPMCYVLANSKAYKKYFKIQNLSFNEFCKMLLDRYSDDWFTDEHFMYDCLNQELDKIIIKNRPFINSLASQRIDRTNWNFNLESLRSGKYIDAHLLRPYSNYSNQINYLLRNLSNVVDYIDVINEKTNLKPNSVLEIGSRDGYDAENLRLAFRIKRNNVWVVEPIPSQVKIIKQNYHGINVLEFAISDKNEKLQFNKVNDKSLIGVSSLLNRIDNLYDKVDSEKIIVECITGEKLLDIINQEIDICKIDVEGLTYEVLTSFGKQINKIKSFHIECEHRPVWNNQKLYDDVADYLVEHGFVLSNFNYVEGDTLQSDSIWVQFRYLKNYNEMILQTAENEINKNNLSLARKYLELIINEEPNNINALNDLAVLEIMNKNWEIAQNIIMKIIQIEPNNEIAKNNFIYLENKLTIHNAILESENLIALEKYSEAKNLLEGVLKNDSENIDALNNLSVVEISLGNYQSAEELIREILSIEPQNEIALNNFDYLNNLFQNENKEKNDKNSNLSEQSFKEENKISTESFVENSSQKKFKNKITIATSIAPKDLEKQKKAIQSWIEVGFDVISINIEEEIVKLEPEFTNVKFIKAQRDARNFAEKPYIYFDDVMEQLSLSGSEVCGIINSDIVLNVKKDFYDFIYNEAKNSFVFGSRVDIKNIDSSEGIFYEYGFDIFFFNRNVISLFPKSDFCLGLPWWDYWIIAIPLIKNIKLKKLISPVAFHLWHKTNYDIKYWKNYGQIFINYLIENNLSKIKNKFFSNYSLEEQNNIISFELLLLFSKKSNHLEFNRINKNIVIRTEALSETNLSPAQFIQSFFTNQGKNIHKINNHLIGQNIDNLIDKGLFQEAYLLLWNLFNSNPKNMIVIQYLTIISFIKKDFNQSTIFINLLKNKFNKNFTNDKIIDYYNNMLKQQDDENTKAIKNEIKEQKDEILVSAIVSVYNSEKFIKGCLEDLINQTLYKKGNLEIIIVNSGSKQNEEEIIIDYKNKYDNIVYIKTEERETIYQAWNRAIKIAKGKFITNANTDDRHSKIAFEKMLDAFQINPTLDVVYADDFMTNIPNDTFDSKTEKKIIKWSNFVKEFLLFGCFIGPHPMWKKSLHNKFGYFDESLNVVGDYEFWLRISQDANFYHLNEILGLYYFSENSVEHKNKKLTDEENQNVQKKYILKYITNFQQLNRIEILLEQIKNYSNLKDYYDLAKNLIKQRKNGLNLQSLIYNIITKFKNIFNPEVDNDLYNEKLIEVDNFIENDNFIIDEEVIQIYNKFKENFNILRTVKSEME